MTEAGARILVQVQPNAKRSEVVGFADGILRVRIAAPPVERKANKALIDFLSSVLGIRKSAIEIVKGTTSRRKAVVIEGVSQAEMGRRLSALSNGE